MENKNTAKTTSLHPLPHPSTPAGANDADADNNNHYYNDDDDDDNQPKDTSIEQKPSSS